LHKGFKTKDYSFEFGRKKRSFSSNSSDYYYGLSYQILYILLHRVINIKSLFVIIIFFKIYFSCLNLIKIAYTTPELPLNNHTSLQDYLSLNWFNDSLSRYRDQGNRIIIIKINK
jgi:hypothetical protein